MHPTDRVSGPADSVTTRRTAKGYQEAVQLSQQKEKASLHYAKYNSSFRPVS